MSMNKTWAISSSISFLISADMLQSDSHSFTLLPVEQMKIDNHTSRGVARYQPARREAAEVSHLFLSRARVEYFRSAIPSGGG
jgi:hypothetical protein